MGKYVFQYYYYLENRCEGQVYASYNLQKEKSNKYNRGPELDP